MTKYDFKTLRKRYFLGSEKWLEMKRLKNDVSEDAVPFSVADMEFICAPEITSGLCEYLNDAVLGYTVSTDEYLCSVQSWFSKKHSFLFEKEEICVSPGVVSALLYSVSALTRPGDGIIIMTPVYYPFYNVVSGAGRKLLRSSLIKKPESYEIDFDDIEKKAKNAKMLILCSPHNPVGRVWTKAELKKIAEICERYGLIIVSDEIHCDITFGENLHTVFANVSKYARENSIICTAPSKTFNLAGMQCSNIIIHNEEMRKKFKDKSFEMGFFSLNALAYKACILAYEKAGDWLSELKKVVYSNYEFLKGFIRENLPEITVFALQGTYLAWLDFRCFSLGAKKMEKLNIKSELFFDEGYVFGKEGEGFERINLACPRFALENLMKKIYEVYKGL